MHAVHNDHGPESVLKKKSNSICYHAVHESASMGYSIIGHVHSVENPADICTKVVSGGQKQNHFIRLLLHYLCDLIILLAEEVCGSWGFPCCMGNYIYIHMEWDVCVWSPVKHMLPQNLQNKLEGSKEDRA
jgi:hypothetical protein